MYIFTCNAIKYSHLSLFYFKIVCLSWSRIIKKFSIQTRVMWVILSGWLLQLPSTLLLVRHHKAQVCTQCLYLYYCLLYILALSRTTAYCSVVNHVKQLTYYHCMLTLYFYICIILHYIFSLSYVSICFINMMYKRWILNA